jgi:hypothetical protein
MDGTGLSLIKCFENVEDPRVDRTKLHKLIDIIVMAICALVAARISPKEFRAGFAMWTKELAGIFTNEVIAIDGQTMRCAKRTGQGKSPIHIVSAWAVGLRLVLAWAYEYDHSQIPPFPHSAVK